MVKNVQDVFRQPKAIVPVTFCSTTANAATFLSSTDYGANFDVTITGIDDTCYISTLSTAPLASNAYKLASNYVMDLKVEDRLYISGSTTATYQAIIWEG